MKRPIILTQDPAISPLRAAYDARIASGALHADAAQEQALEPLARLLAELAAPKPTGILARLKKPSAAPKGVYMWGGVGRGKSMLMDLFYAASPVPARRVHFHAFMQDIHASLHKARQDGVEDALKPVIAGVADAVRLLCFDEMQITDITDAMIVGRLFEGLMAAGVAIVTTSNRAPSELYKNGLNRQLFLPFIDILTAQMDVYHLESPRDHRQGRIGGGAVYFSPVDAAARRAIDDIWVALLDGAAPASLVLRVKGRDVELAAYHNGMARVSFWDMCATARGAADYLAIADAVRVLILDDIPLLSRNNFNEAKRFVTLIDALYEAKVRLIASAADIPERLYVEGEGSFEFERTASRLREMQDAAWGQDTAPA